jgi:hypothetical protein
MLPPFLYPLSMQPLAFCPVVSLLLGFRSIKNPFAVLTGLEGLMHRAGCQPYRRKAGDGQRVLHLGTNAGHLFIQPPRTRNH